jgi:tRNA threonylcarbamoyladenosine biosynthesis protein TsaE
VATFTRVSVHPDFQRHGIASAMVAEAEALAARSGYRTVELLAREELAELVEFWRHRGFRVDRTVPHGMILARELPVVVRVPTAAGMRRLGERLADLLQPGDVVIATGDLGAGKTTLTQGIGRGLGTAGRVISPTFVLSRIHPSTTGRPRLVHVDAYRLGGPAELEDLDLDATVADSVTVVEWGRGVAEGLAADRLEIDIWRSPSRNGNSEPDSERVVTLRAVGARWVAARLAALAEPDHG